MRGVTWNKTNQRWRAQLQQRYLGEFCTQEEACEARLQAEIDTFGQPQDQAEPIVEGDIAKLPIFNRIGKVVAWAVVDLADISIVIGRRWCRTRSGYPVTRIDGQVVYLHRLLIPGNFLVDHRDRIKLNARRENLRACSTAENCRNTKLGKNNRSGFKGVSKVTSGQGWRARIMVGRKEVRLGIFASAEEAGLAYDEAARQLHGAFASPNADRVAA